MYTSAAREPDRTQLYPSKLSGSVWGQYELYIDWNLDRNLHLGKQQSTQEAVWIKTFSLPESAENQARRDYFRQIIDLNLNLGGGPDFRLIQLRDFAVTSQGCHLVMQPIENALSLLDYLSKLGPLLPQQVKQFLHQSLESLRYLHTACPVIWPGGIERGICHGNLLFESFWIRPVPRACQIGSKDFQVYLTNLALWEQIFWLDKSLASSSQTLGSLHGELRALGKIGTQLLVQSGEYASQPELAHFLRRLSTQTERPFRTTEEALQALRSLPNRVTSVSRVDSLPCDVSPSDPSAIVTDESAPQPHEPQVLSWLQKAKLTLTVSVGLMGLSWFGYVGTQWLLGRIQNGTGQVEIAATYALEPESPWKSVLQSSVSDDEETLLDGWRQAGYALAIANPVTGR